VRELDREVSRRDSTNLHYKLDLGETIKQPESLGRERLDEVKDEGLRTMNEEVKTGWVPPTRVRLWKFPTELSLRQ